MPRNPIEVGIYSGIGRVLSRHDSARAFPDYNKLQAEVVAGSRSEVFTRVLDLKNNPEGGELILAPGQFAEIGYERLIELERDGIVSTRFTPEYPLGQFALNQAPRSLLTLEELVGGGDSQEFNPIENSIFRLSNNFKGVPGFSLVTRPAIDPQDVDKTKFKDVMTTAKVVATCTKDEQGNWVWNESHIYPDGDVANATITSGDQYGVGGFEGMNVFVNTYGEIILFRPELNAQRFADSCSAIGIPPMSEEQYLDSVRAAVLANKDFLPEAGSSKKMYIRPFVNAGGGGESAGLGMPEAFTFLIQVFPYGYYAGDKNKTLSLAFMHEERRALPGQGNNKIKGNYPLSIKRKEQAKRGELPDYPNEKFDDILYAGQTSEGDRIDEVASANMFAIKIDKESGDIVIYTPSLERKTNLPGTTRKTLVELLPNLGFRVIEGEISMSELETMDGVFLSGTAAGIVRVGSITLRDRKLDFDKAPENSQNATAVTKAYFSIHKALYDARKAELDLEQIPEAKEWAKVIGRVDKVDA